MKRPLSCSHQGFLKCLQTALWEEKMFFFASFVARSFPKMPQCGEDKGSVGERVIREFLLLLLFSFLFGHYLHTAVLRSSSKREQVASRVRATLKAKCV